MPSSRAISAIGRPLLRTSSTASRLNSAVNWRRFLGCLSSMRTSSAQGRCPASGGKSTPIRSLLELVTDPGLETAVLCGHGEQIGGLVRQLADGGLVGDASLRWAKGSTWVLDTNQGRVVGARYLAPLRLKDLAGHY